MTSYATEKDVILDVLKNIIPQEVKSDQLMLEFAIFKEKFNLALADNIQKLHIKPNILVIMKHLYSTKKYIENIPIHIKELTLRLVCVQTSEAVWFLAQFLMILNILIKFPTMMLLS